jgi:hypothetical protein
MSNAQNSNGVNNNAKQHIRRAYGVERTFGDILLNPQTKSVFARIDLGAFSLSLSFVRRSDKKTYDLFKSYVAKDGTAQLVKLGQTFPATRRDGSEVENVSRATIGLFRQYDKELKKELTRSNDALFINVIKLKEPKVLGESGLQKVGFITGVFGIELEGDNAKAANNGDANNAGANDYAPDESQQVVQDDEIPF